MVGSLNILECSRKLNIHHLLMASTSSVYGANKDMPFGENDKARSLQFMLPLKPIMAHSYAHLWNLPITMFPLFTVYGPWGGQIWLCSIR